MIYRLQDNREQHTADGSTVLTVAANDRYFIDTTAAAQTATLPASPQVGDTIRFLDISGTFDTNNLTVARNGKKINRATSDLVVATENAGFALVFTGDTNGWLIQDK